MILAAHALGTSWFGLRRALSIFGVNYLSQGSFEQCQTLVGAALKYVAEQSMKNAFLEEVRLSYEAGEGTYYTKELGTKPALTLFTDTGWNKRSSGRGYDSPSGITNMIGEYSKKIIDSVLAINQCQFCNKVKKWAKKKERTIKFEKKAKEEKCQNKINRYSTHKCLKTFNGSSKAMEADSIVGMVLNFPLKHDAYVCKLFMDDDATTPSNLKEDTGPNSSGRLPKYLAGILVLADPSHRKRVVGNAYYNLAKKR